ncbi:MAG: transcriptional regulator [Bacteroidetes bacterium]|nr:transcriptional regulator [Bacteroidota bacterium]
MGNLEFQANEYFMRALKKAKLQTFLSRLQMERTELLSFYDVKELVKPKRQTYRGMKAIRVDRIIGSEGRYKDFNKAFFPKKALLKGRWESISKAHLQMIDLPAISVYKIGDAYFVRDGNHRVSVAKTLKVEFIDADIVELDAEINLEPGMTDRQLREKVVAYERKRVIKSTTIESILDMDSISFTAPGRYTEMLHHINVHKYYINLGKMKEITFEEAAQSWYKNVYYPIVEAVKTQKLLSKFPGRTNGDLYMWIVKHWNRLKGQTGQEVHPADASKDFAEQYGLPLFRRFLGWVKNIFNRTV